MESFSCKKCTSKYDSRSSLPLVISCGHTLCKSCYDKCIDDDTNKLKCPFDEKVFPVAKDLPIN